MQWLPLCILHFRFPPRTKTTREKKKNMENSVTLALMEEIAISRHDLKPPRDSPLSGVVQVRSPINLNECLLPEDCKPPDKGNYDCYRYDYFQFYDEYVAPYVSCHNSFESLLEYECNLLRHGTSPDPMYPKIFGFDVYGNEIEEYFLPGIKYSWPSLDESVEEIVEKQWAYKEGRIRIQNLNQAKLFAKFHQAINPYHIPVDERETAEKYCQNMMEFIKTKDGYSSDQYETLNETYTVRQRRKMTQGSYPNSSVQEESLPSILRYTWKGKIKKLEKYLSESKQWIKINNTDGDGRTALHFAASWGCLKTMKVLLKIPNIRLNIKDREGKTPLYKAVEIKSLPCVELLTRRGSLARLHSRDGRTPIEFILIEHGDDNFEIFKHFYHTRNMWEERKHEGRLTYLHLICLAGAHVKSEKIAKELLASGEFINATEGKGRTPLILATQMNRKRLLEIFLKQGADVNHYDLEMRAAIQYSKTKEVFKMIKRFS